MTGTPTARVATCQFEPVVGDVRANAERIDSLAGRADADLAVFPELCLTGYDLPTARERATAVPGELTDPLVETAARTDTALVVGLPERDGDALYNAFVLVDGDGVQGTYRKRFPWGAESDVFGVGDGPVVAETSAGRLGFLLCYDLNFPEAALEYSRLDCDVLAVGAAWRTSFREDWRLLCRSRALDGPCYVVGANHVGDQRGREHAGRSLVAGPRGQVLAEADDAPGVEVATVEREALAAARERNPVRETRRNGRS